MAECPWVFELEYFELAGRRHVLVDFDQVEVKLASVDDSDLCVLRNQREDVLLKYLASLNHVALVDFLAVCTTVLSLELV